MRICEHSYLAPSPRSDWLAPPRRRNRQHGPRAGLDPTDTRSSCALIGQARRLISPAASRADPLPGARATAIDTLRRMLSFRDTAPHWLCRPVRIRQPSMQSVTRPRPPPVADKLAAARRILCAQMDTCQAATPILPGGPCCCLLVHSCTYKLCGINSTSWPADYSPRRDCARRAAGRRAEATVSAAWRALGRRVPRRTFRAPRRSRRCRPAPCAPAPA